MAHSGAVCSRASISACSTICGLPDPGTSFVLLCGGADIPALDRWMKGLLTASVLTGPIVLAGADLTPETTRYLTAVAAQAEALQGNVLRGAAAPPAAGARRSAGARLGDDRRMSRSWMRAHAGRRQTGRRRCAPASPIRAWPGRAPARWCRWPRPAASPSRGRSSSARIRRLGAGHLADDPGPGGWLVVDQEASAVTPPALLARREALAACRSPTSPGDALWIDLCAQLRAAGGRIVWTPDVSFVGRPSMIRPDPDCAFRAGTPAARAIAWADPYHHPALSLHGDLLAAEQRLGLVRAAPADPPACCSAASPRMGRRC